MSSLAITWLGHSAFILDLPSGQRVALDPWLGNPRCPPALARAGALGRIDLVLVTHAHDDHAADLVSIARATGAPVICPFEMGHFLTLKGLTQVRDMGIGGTQIVGGIRITMTQAAHGNAAAGFVIRAAGVPTIYYAGDTGLFGDMKMIADVYGPEIAFLPIGDHYTMGPDTAAIAARWLRVRQVVPMHWGTFPLLTGTPAALREHLDGSGIDVLELAPGETAR